MSQTFAAKLAEAVATNNSLICVGLDPDPALMPHDDVVKFNTDIIEHTSDLVCAYKPNLAFYEAMGESGWGILRDTLAAIPPEIPIIGDAKRGDIGNTAAAYAKSLFDVLGCDAITVNAFGGKDAMEPFLDYTERGIFVWARSSNPSAIDFQDLIVEYEGQRRPFWQAVALKSVTWNRHGNVGIVVGATYPQQLAEARELCPGMQILVPGIGAQEGALKDAVQAGLTPERDGIIVNASRSIIYAARDNDYAMAARAAAAQLREQVNRHREQRTAPAEAWHGP